MTASLTKQDVQALLAELVGMTMFVYTGVGTAHQTVVNGPFEYHNQAAFLPIAMAFGLGITCFAYGTAGYSGGHLNPAVTTSLMMLGEITPVLGGMYIAAQCLGATIGAILAALADPYTIGFALNVIGKYACNNPNLSAYDLNECQANHWDTPSATECTANPSVANPACGAKYMWGPAFVVEFVGTFMLVMTVCWTAVSKKSLAGNCAPIAIGLSVMFAHFTAIPVTNCSINPARALGAAIAGSMMPYHAQGSADTTHDRISEAWEHVALFWVFPILGGAAAALIFKFGFAEESAKTEDVAVKVEAK